MLDLKELKEIALANVSDPTTEYFFRYVCRWYSKTFHTPLHVVIAELSPLEVFLAYFEEGYEMMDEEDRLIEVMRAIDPDFDEKEEESIQEFIKMIEEEEENKRLAKAERDRARNLSNSSDDSQPMPDTRQSYSSQHKVQDNDNDAAPTTPTTPVIRTFDDDIPDDELGLEEE